MTVRNGERFIAGAIESVLNQTHGDLELLIFDDASADSSPHIIETYLKSDRRVKYWRSDSPLGLMSSYNQCLQHAQGVFIKPMDQYDLLAPDMLTQSVARFYCAPGLSLLAAGSRQIDEADDPANAQPVAVSDFIRVDYFISGIEVVRQSLFPLRNFLGRPGTVLFPAARKGQGFDCNFSYLGDLEYWLRIILDGAFHYLPVDLVTSRRPVKQAYAQSVRLAAGAPMAVAQDVVYFAKKHSWMLESFQLGKERFYQAASPYLAKVVASDCCQSY